MNKHMSKILVGACTAALFFGLGVGYLLFSGATGLGAAYVQAYSPPTDMMYASTSVIPAAEYAPFLPMAPGSTDRADAAPPPIPHRYIVTMVDGFIAVVDAQEGVLLELTTTPTSTFSIYDLDRLRNGIRIYTDEALARILQDYGS